MIAPTFGVQATGKVGRWAALSLSLLILTGLPARADIMGAQDRTAVWGGETQNDANERLRAALAKYQAIADAGGWATLPGKMPTRGGRRAAFVAELRQRLAAEGDLSESYNISFEEYGSSFDDDVRQGVRRFQTRNGLHADGKVTAKTIQRLNIPVAERIRQIELNLERNRTALRELPATRVEVNAAAATAALYRGGTAYLKMNAVVGAPGHNTPTLSSTISTVVLNPQWNVPHSITTKEIAPLLKRNPNYLTENRMYWSGKQLIQEPGPQNALGRIKFEFPNRYSVYLHDTPAKHLFANPERAESHGCVRLERPLELAEELLRGDPEWSRESIEEAIRGGETTRIALGEPMPVVITYQTVFVEDDGEVHFRPDIYGLDAQRKVASQGASMQEPEPMDEY